MLSSNVTREMWPFEWLGLMKGCYGPTEGTPSLAANKERWPPVGERSQALAWGGAAPGRKFPQNFESRVGGIPTPSSFVP